MSLLVAYFDKLRAVVASDDRAVVEENSTRTPLPGRFPKFRILKSAVLGAVVLGFVGRNDLAEKLWAGTERMMSGNPTMSFRDLAESLPQFTRIAFSKRQPLQIIEGDKLDGLLAGYDRAQGRMRVLVWRSEDDFHVVEPSQDPNARVLALGAFELSNEDALHRLTARMQRAGRMESSWIVDSLRFTVAKLHDMHPLVIGAPSFYAALDRSGSVELPAEFPPPDSESLLPSAVGARLYAGRFFVGSITTPAAGKPDTIGNDDGGAGAQSGQVNTHYLGNLGTFLAITPGGNGVKTNEPAMVDGNGHRKLFRGKHSSIDLQLFAAKSNPPPRSDDGEDFVRHSNEQFERRRRAIARRRGSCLYRFGRGQPAGIPCFRACRNNGGQGNCVGRHSRR